MDIPQTVVKKKKMSDVDAEEQKRIELEQEQEKKLMEKQGGQLPQKKEPLVKPRVKKKKKKKNLKIFR